MEKYRIEVSGTPVAKQRPRGFKNGKGNIRFYTPTASKNFEYLVRQHAEQIFKKPLMTPLKVTLTFFMPRPKNMYWKTKPMPAVINATGKDIDNLSKSVLDGLNKVAYINDSQVGELHAKKMYHAGDDSPKTIIVIEDDIS
jgi:crossover junction endodeoxyribonuclease RusA